ncbi:MAG: glycoside hydrolase family 88 protein [Prevotellaceae bacterium]|nr:glycoside hydrolase family 88 protein [Prevotellaceae bacterium]MDY2749256.1 glycoside hydrolase family 88 protein [Prevotella sp.]
MKQLFFFILTMMVLLPCSIAAQGETSAQVLKKIEKVNDYWQANNSPQCRAFWDNAAYFTGNMEAYRLTGKAQYYEYSEKWCRHNNWMGATSNDKSRWRYKTYGEGNDFVLFGDWQICFQTYIDMYNLVPADYKVARAIEVMSHECSMEDNKFWWWADALYMVMPVMTKMYLLTGEVKYLDKLHENFLWSDSLMWDKEAQLYYRDGKYIWPKVTTACDGGKSFWARGDGWVLAGLAKVLADMPRDYQHRPIFVQRFQQLAEGVARCQQPGGYWSRSMLCEDDAPGPETSGTAFFCYGLLWGVNHGYLDKAQYAPVIEKAWNYLSTKALQADGSIGYVQPIGEKPDPTKIVDARSQAPFGTGAWLLAACERVRYLDGTASQQPLQGAPRTADGKSMTVTVSNPTAHDRCDVVELSADAVFSALGIAGGRQFLVLDGDNVERPYQLTHDGKVLFQAFVAPMKTATFTIKRGEPRAARLDCNGRIYPDREDDLTWENDKCAWRMYGPKMHNKGVSGFDTFAKNVTYPVQDALYHSELTSYAVNARLKKVGRGSEWAQLHRDVYTYHRDRGQGMDAYTVGTTLGAGAPALMDGGNLIMPDVYEKAEIIENGPLRFCVRLQMYEQHGIRETRTFTQDKGTHLARVEVAYSGAAAGTPVASGIVVHKSQPTAYAINKKASYIAYSDALDTPQGQNGQLFIGCYYPEKMKALKYQPLPEEKAGGIGHVLGITTLAADKPFTYYTGSAWSKYDVPTMAVWEQLLQHYADNIKNPLKVEIR